MLLIGWFGAANAQLVINEVSNGPSGVKEYVELLVVGTPSGCTQQCVDLRGWILDDNNGYFASGSGTGIAQGHMRFANDPTWACVPIGTLIVVYNDGDRNSSIPADNLTGANCTYIVPASSALFEKNASTPVVNGSMAYGGPYTSGGNWANTQGLSNTDDSYQVRDPNNLSVPYHAVSYGNNTTTPIIYFSGGAGGDVMYMNNSVSNDPFVQANWTKAPVSGAGNETPGAPNNAANATWIHSLNNNCTPLVVPVVDAGTDDTICLGASATLTATCNVTGGTYTWSSGQNGATITVSPTVNTMYKVTFDNGGGCTSVDSVWVRVNTPPTVTAGPDRNVCSGQSVLLVAVGTPTGGTYLWNEGTANDSLLVNPGGTTTYSVIYTAVNGCTDTDSVVLNYFTNPVVTIANAPTICSGDTAVLSASTSAGAGTFVWSDTHVGATDTVHPTGNTNYSVTFTSSLSGCSGAAQINLAVNPTPVINAGADQTICSGDTAHISATSSALGIYSWSNGATGQNIDVFPTVNDTLVLTFTATNTCFATDTLVINVNPSPTVTVTPHDTTLCSGNSLDITATGSTAGTYQWSNGQTGPNITILPTSTQTYTVTLTENLHGCTATDTSRVVYLLTPTVSAGNDTAICTGTNANLLATANVLGGSYTWSNGPNTASNPVGPLANTVYSVTFTGVNGCSATDNVSVTVNSLPTANAGSGVTTCPGATSVLTATGGTTYAWSNNATTDTAHVNPTTTTTYQVTVTNANHCTASASVTVTIDPSLINATALEQDLTCFNTVDGQVRVIVTVGSSPYSYTLTDGSNNYGPSTDSSFNNLPAGTYTATVTDNNGCVFTMSNLVVGAPPALVFNVTTDGVSCNGAGNGVLHIDNDTLRYSLNGAAFRFDTLFTNLQGGSYTVIGQDIRGCSDTVTTAITEPDVLQVSITPDTSDILRGETVSLNSTVTGGTEPYTYVWLPDSSLSCADCANPVASPTDTTNYILLVSDSAGCMDSSFAYISVHRPFIITFPSAFSPNNDGHNDRFRAITNGVVTKYSLKVYNRWGELVYQTTNLKDGWDGTYKGADQPNSTFVWVAEYLQSGAAETTHTKGNVTLIR